MTYLLPPPPPPPKVNNNPFFWEGGRPVSLLPLVQHEQYRMFKKILKHFRLLAKHYLYINLKLRPGSLYSLQVVGPLALQTLI